MLPVKLYWFSLFPKGTRLCRIFSAADSHSEDKQAIIERKLFQSCMTNETIYMVINCLYENKVFIS